MVDYSVNGTFDLHRTDQNDFAVVDGREEFEQDLIIQIHDRFSDIIGGKKNSDTIKEKVSLLANRLAKEFGVIDEVQQIRVNELPDKPETVSLEIFYVSGENFEETL